MTFYPEPPFFKFRIIKKLRQTKKSFPCFVYIKFCTALLKKASDARLITTPRSSLVIVILFDFISGEKRLTAFFIAVPSDFPFSREGRELIVLPNSARRPVDKDIPPVGASV